jgi:tRNA(Ile)-lysidine synthase
LQEAQSMVDDAAIMVYQQVAKQIDDSFHLLELKRLNNYRSYLYQWLKIWIYSLARYLCSSRKPIRETSF